MGTEKKREVCMRRSLIRAAFCVVLTGLAARGNAGEIGFVEQFSLADDRAEPLKQLIPGTEEFYYYHCLHYQNTGQLDKVPEVLDQWIKRYNFTPRVEEIRNRQALLTYGKDPQGTLALIKQRLDLRFNHQKQVLNAKPDLPRALDQNLISREALSGVALSRYPNTLQGFEDSALDFLSKGKLEGDRLRDFLRRLQRPDYPDLAKRVIEDLRFPNSGGFGSIPIHAKLLLAQLDECLALKPDLLQDSNFVNAYLTKLQPGADVDWQHDDKEKVAYLERLWAFAGRLPPAQNSLKACILYRRLTFDVSRDVYDKARFLDYLRLPRPVFYINPRYLDRQENRGYAVNLNADYRRQTALEPIGLDVPLVRRCLMRFLLDAPDYAEFADYIGTNYLKKLFAETKIVAGMGDMEQWYSLLPPEKVRDLKERVDLELLPTNPEVVGANEPVRLDVAVKNVPTLLVRTYVLNAFNYYRDKGEEITTAVDLDGLVANAEKTVKYTQVPLHRHAEKLEFPDIAKPGVYVIELIGNGQSSRALIRKGRLTFMERTGSAGHVFTVYDEQNNVVTNAALWLTGHEYKADDAGEVAVPFSTSPGSQKIILVHEGFAVLCAFDHQAENYALSAGIHADRESLLDGRMCKVLVRPELRLNGRPVDIKLLEEASLTIQTTDQDGIQSSKVVNDFKLQNDRESVYEFRVPDKLSEIAFILSGKVQSLSQNKKVDLSDRDAVTVNGMDKTEKTEMLLLRHAGGRFAVELLGKTGEPRADRPVQFDFKHRDFRDQAHAALQTDAGGAGGPRRTARHQPGDRPRAGGHGADLDDAARLAFVSHPHLCGSRRVGHGAAHGGSAAGQARRALAARSARRHVRARLRGRRGPARRVHRAGRSCARRLRAVPQARPADDSAAHRRGQTAGRSRARAEQDDGIARRAAAADRGRAGWRGHQRRGRPYPHSPQERVEAGPRTRRGHPLCAGRVPLRWHRLSFLAVSTGDAGGAARVYLPLRPRHWRRIPLRARAPTGCDLPGEYAQAAQPDSEPVEPRKDRGGNGRTAKRRGMVIRA